MGLKENFQKLIERKQDEIRELEVQIREAHAYLQALQDSARLLPKEEKLSQPSSGVTKLRAGTDLAKARDIIASAGIPMHINAILEKMGKTVDQRTRVSLVGTLGGYSRKEKIFTRPAPNTFGLIGMESPASPERDEDAEDAIPEDFGRMA